MIPFEKYRIDLALFYPNGRTFTLHGNKELNYKSRPKRLRYTEDNFDDLAISEKRKNFLQYLK
jgi:hypothetical protein